MSIDGALEITLTKYGQIETFKTLDLKMLKVYYLRDHMGRAVGTENEWLIGHEPELLVSSHFEPM
jgi:hypothetical protein